MLTKKQWIDKGWTIVPKGAWIDIYPEDGELWDAACETLGIDGRDLKCITLGITAYMEHNNDDE